jgi:transposase InsO family protein
MDYYRTHGRNAAQACRHFGISRQTFYRWKRRFDPHDLSSLEDRSHRPHHCRRPTWTPRLVERVMSVRQRYPRWGKDKLVVLLHQQGVAISTSMVGRILAYLKAHGRLHEPPRQATAGRRPRRIRHRPWATRKPPVWPIQQPGDLVQIDTKELRPARGVVRQHFSARDMVSRWDVLYVAERATAATAVEFLDALLARMPFPLRALQVDGGSEFAAEFEQACQARGLPLFVLPRCSPKLNGHVERAHRTHNEEFYEIVPTDWSLPRLNQQLRRWETIYNNVRPHQALGYLTPRQFLLQWKSKRKEPECH